MFTLSRTRLDRRRPCFASERSADLCRGTGGVTGHVHLAKLVAALDIAQKCLRSTEGGGSDDNSNSGGGGVAEVHS